MSHNVTPRTAPPTLPARISATHGHVTGHFCLLVADSRTIRNMTAPHFNRGRKRPDLAEWNKRNNTSRTPILERLAARSVTVNDCILWTGTTVKGYGHISINGKTVTVHRAAWIARHGPIPPETPQVLHHCDTPLCWADAHLYLGTNSDNMHDRNSRGRNPQRNKTHCKFGHPFNAENTYVRANGIRVCRACNRARALKTYSRQRVAK